MQKPYRAAWGDFPDVVIMADELAVKRHPEYPQAKAGDVAQAASAAKRLAAALVPADGVARLEALLQEDAFLVPVHAMEGGGLNRIPGAFAELLAKKLGLEVETDIVQANVVNHTGANGWARMARAPVFSGNVTAGRRYVLVDDFVGQGGTLANLRGHIIHGGGNVIGAVTLTGRPYSAKLAHTEETLKALREKHGKEIENWWHEQSGYPVDHLTESESRYLVHTKDADTIRTKLAEAGSSGDD
jgi:hypothetical protein